VEEMLEQQQASVKRERDANNHVKDACLHMWERDITCILVCGRCDERERRKGDLSWVKWTMFLF
jgi:hypothetical protein